MNFVLRESRVNGSRYYTVEMDLGLAGFLHSRRWQEVEDWCWTTFGPRPMNAWPEAGDRWFANNRKFWFREEKDLTLFLLKWQSKYC